MLTKEKIDAYRSIVETAELELKGKNNLYTSHNGHMFSFFGKDDIVAVRLSKEDQEAFVAEYKTPYPVKQYGANMRDYVELPDELLSDPKKAAKYIKTALAYIKTLPPK